MELNPSLQLLHLEHIKQVKARYCRLIDTKQWSRLTELFTDDSRFEGLGSAPSGCDRATFIAGVSGRLQDCISIHHCHTPEIAFTGADTARAIWAMTDYLEWPEGITLREAPGQTGFHGFGYYEEEYRFDGREWKIAFLRLTRLRVDPLPASRTPPSTGVLLVPLGPAASMTDWLAPHPAEGHAPIPVATPGDQPLLDRNQSRGA